MLRHQRFPPARLLFRHLVSPLHNLAVTLHGFPREPSPHNRPRKTLPKRLTPASIKDDACARPSGGLLFRYVSGGAVPGLPPAFWLHAPYRHLSSEILTEDAVASLELPKSIYFISALYTASRYRWMTDNQPEGFSLDN